MFKRTSEKHLFVVYYHEIDQILDDYLYDVLDLYDNILERVSGKLILDLLNSGLKVEIDFINLYLDDSDNAYYIDTENKSRLSECFTSDFCFGHGTFKYQCCLIDNSSIGWGITMDSLYIKCGFDSYYMISMRKLKSNVELCVNGKCVVQLNADYLDSSVDLQCVRLIKDSNTLRVLLHINSSEMDFEVEMDFGKIMSKGLNHSLCGMFSDDVILHNDVEIKACTFSSLAKYKLLFG